MRSTVRSFDMNLCNKRKFDGFTELLILKLSKDPRDVDPFPIHCAAAAIFRQNSEQASAKFLAPLGCSIDKVGDEAVKTMLRATDEDKLTALVEGWHSDAVLMVISCFRKACVDLLADGETSLDTLESHPTLADAFNMAWQSLSSEDMVEPSFETLLDVPLDPHVVPYMYESIKHLESSLRDKLVVQQQATAQATS
jgi:hypothetical protein